MTETIKRRRTSPISGTGAVTGSHTCYWGVVKLLKGLSFMPTQNRSAEAESLLGRCVEFILKHRICFSSHRPADLLNRMIGRLTLPNMYKSDFLEILWLLKREGIRSDRMDGALELLEGKMKPDGTWALEHQVKDLIVPITGKKLGNELITERAREVMDYYGRGHSHRDP